MFKKIWNKIVNYYRFKAIVGEAKEVLGENQYHLALTKLDELGLFDDIDLKELRQKAHHLGLIYELTRAIDALIRAEGMAREINFPRRELELLREKIEYIQGRAEPNLKNIETVV